MAADEAGKRVREAHPEVSFRAMAGEPLPYSKEVPEGRAMRRLLLEEAGILLPAVLGPAAAVPLEDVLDAASAAWTAARIAAGTAARLSARSEPGDPGVIWY